MEIIEGYTVPLRGRGAPQKYPWDQWLKHGVTVCIVKGEDFDVDVQIMRQMLYAKSKTLQGRVSTEIRETITHKPCIWLTYHSGELNLEVMESN
jgi:hypothetical protein